MCGNAGAALKVCKRVRCKPLKAGERGERERRKIRAEGR